MPSQHRFEGPDLEALLEDVRARFGTDADIVEANRIRKGGVGGFFARELFEVVVSDDEPDDVLDDELDGGLDDGPVGAPRDLLDLVDAVDDGPAPDFASADTVQQLLAATDDPPLPDDPGRAPAPAGSAEGVATLLARMQGAGAAADTDVARPTPTTLSTDGERFADVLARIAASTVDAPAGARHDRADDRAHDRAGEPFRSYAETATPVARPATPAPEPMASAPAPAPESPRPAPRGLRVRPDEHGPAIPVATDGLVKLGLPTDLLDRVDTTRDRLSVLVDLAERFPVAHRLPDRGDCVIAVIGDRAGMERAIGWINQSLGLPTDALMLATRSTQSVFPETRRIGGHEDAAVLRRTWRRRSRPVLVAVDHPVGLRDTAWARHVLDALEPAAVWGVVDAAHKPEDVAEWGARIGGVDAIALDGTDATASPASVLTTGLPVALLDGQAATPARWAAVLDERLTAA